MSRWQGKTAIITGAASGLGRALAETLAARGARVVVSDLNGPGAEQVARAIGGRAVTCDVTSPEQVAQLYASVDRLDYSFANAGFAMAGMAHDLTTEHFEELLAVDLTGAIRCTQTAYRRMREQGSGHLVTTASLAGLVGFPGMLPYSTAKAALVRYSLDLRVEASLCGVKVTTLCPAFLHTGIFESARMINLDSAGIRSNLPMPIEAVEPAVVALLRGVERNRAVVTYPWYSGVLWWLHRFSPGVLQLLSRLILRSVQKGKIIREPGSDPGR